MINPRESLGVSPAKAMSVSIGEFTQSSIHTFMSCPQKFALNYLLKIRRPGNALALITGSAVHEGFDILLRLRQQFPDGDLAKQVAVAEETVHEYFDERLEHELMDPNVLSGMDQSRAQAIACLRGFYIVHGDKIEDWQVIEVEQEVRVDRDHPRNLASKVQNMSAGKIDGIVRTPGGMVLMLEHKTTSSLQFHSGAGLEMDGQLLWYQMLCEIVCDSIGCERIDGVFYNVIAKPQHRTPRDDFKGLVNKMVEAMRESPERYFMPSVIAVDPEKVRMARRNFDRVISLMQYMQDGEGRWVKNLKACRDFGGCQYLPLCAAGADVNDPDAIFDLDEMAVFEVQEKTHMELE